MYKIFVVTLIAFFIGTSISFAITNTDQKLKAETVATETSTEVVVSDSDKIESKLQTLYSKYKTLLEEFRNKQALYFSTLRDETKIKLGIEVTGDILKDLAPTFSPPPAPMPIGTDDPKTMGEVAPKKMDNPMDYATLIFATSLASLFSSVLMFYGVLAFLVFLLIRVFFRMFV
jgi:hypothetical protein